MDLVNDILALKSIAKSGEEIDGNELDIIFSKNTKLGSLEAYDDTLGVIKKTGNDLNLTLLYRDTKAKVTDFRMKLLKVEKDIVRNIRDRMKDKGIFNGKIDTYSEIGILILGYMSKEGIKSFNDAQ